MTGWLTALLLAGVVVTSAPARARGHDFHVSYTRMAVETGVLSAQIRLFTDDVTQALIERSKKPSMTLDSPGGDAAFRAYLIDMFQVTANGRRLVPVVVSGAREKNMFSWIVTWTSATPITSLALHNAALMELFDDQQNIVRIKHIATGRETTMFYSGGSKADQVFRF